MGVLVCNPSRGRGSRMNRNAMSKLLASFFVLVMALSTMTALPIGRVSAASVSNDISLLVLDDTNGNTVDTATVTLINVHTGDVIQAHYSSGLYVASNAPSGVYRVNVSAGDYYDNLNAVPAGLRFDGLAPYVGNPITLTPLPTRSYYWNMTVQNPTGTKLTGVTVGFYDAARHEVLVSQTTNALGYTILSMFEVPALGDIWLFAKKGSYATYAEQVTVTADLTTTITLDNAKVVRGLVRNNQGILGSNTVAYLIDNDTSLPMIKRVMKSDLGSGSYVLYAHPGDFTLCVDADGLSSYIGYVSIAPSTPYVFRDLTLGNQTQRIESVSIDYGANYGSFTLGVDTTWSYDDIFPGLLYNDVGRLRLQIDLNTAVPDMNVDALEASDFEMTLLGYGSQYVTTSKLLMVNSTVYKSADTLSTFILDDVSGPVSMTTGVHYQYTCAYTAVSEIDVGAPDYTVSAYARYSTASVNYDYKIALAPDYELVDNSTGSASSHVNLTGYLTLDMNSQVYVGGPELVTMTWEKSMRPSAGAGMDVSSPYVYAVTDEGGNVTKYIVRVDREVNFTTLGSLDPNGNPLTYTWRFGDGSSDLVTENATAPYNYTTTPLGAERTVNLTVTDVSDWSNWTEITVVCDALEPNPVINVKDRTPVGGEITLNQSQLVTFNATGSSDDAASTGDGMGVIDWVQFEYGDGNKSDRIYFTDTQQNVSHAYESAGDYTVLLNVTDVVGHLDNTTLKVHVNDTQAPTATFKAMNETWGTSLIENITVTFDASGTRDNVDNYTLMHYSWYFDDKEGANSWLNGTGLFNVTHVFNKTGNFAVRVNVTDLFSNWNGYTKRVIVAASPRPDVRIDDISFSKDPTQGSDMTITVNVTNRGSANATGVLLTFYIEHDDGTETLIGTSSALTNNTGANGIPVTGKDQVNFTWKPDHKGSYSIKVNCTSTNQLEVHDMTDVVTVKENPTTRVFLWVGVAAVVILVPLALYFRGRLSKREKKGPRREEKK
jgi:hypothetical protein